MEIAIVGAGPAGAWTAYRLARTGARVTLLDPSHPREKPCGGGITGRALALVGDALGGTLPGVAIRSVRLRRDDGDSAIVPLSGADEVTSAPLVVASRRDFDALLTTAAVTAGARLLQRRVGDVTKSGRGWRLDFAGGGSLEVDWVVGADGANSLVRRRVLQPFRRDQLSIATGYYAEGVTSDEIVLEIVGDPPGYLWSFPRPDHIAIGIGAQADAGASAAALRERTRRWIADAAIAPAARLVSYSWPIPTLPTGDLGALVASGDRWLLAGDAAGLVDPITREGIFFALQAADHAAAALAGSVDPARDYRERLHDEIVPELARAARLKAGFFQPRFTTLLFSALERSAAIRAVFADLVAGRQPYRTLKWRLVKTLEIGLAWNALAAQRAQ